MVTGHKPQIRAISNLIRPRNLQNLDQKKSHNKNSTLE